MEEPITQHPKCMQGNNMIKPAVSLAKMLAAHIGMVADGKVYYFRQDFLKEMEKKAGHTIEFRHLASYCLKKGKTVNCYQDKCYISFNALSITEQEWFEDLKEKTKEEEL